MTEIERNIKLMSQFATKHGLDVAEFVQRVSDEFRTYLSLGEVMSNVRRHMQNAVYERNVRIACQALADAAKDNR